MLITISPIHDVESACPRLVRVDVKGQDKPAYRVLASGISVGRKTPIALK
jgi:hypothetical protein